VLVKNPHDYDVFLAVTGEVVPADGTVDVEDPTAKALLAQGWKRPRKGPRKTKPNMEEQ
jgi:hypothetical protein